MDLPVIRPTVGADSLNSEDQYSLSGVDGRPVAVVHTAPPLLMQLARRRLNCDKAEGVLDGLFGAAGRLFATAELDGAGPQEYSRRAALATGLPIGVYHRALAAIPEEMAYLDTLRPLDQRSFPAPYGGAVDATVRWVPRGRLLTVVCPSNHPEPHLSWARGLAAGYSVFVRPGSTDPLTPARLSAALVQAGLARNRLAVLPSDHNTADLLVRVADRAIVYGGPAAVRRWSGHPQVLVRGPGYSKALVDVPVGEAVLEHLARAVAGDGGVRCTNLSVIRTSGDVVALAEGLAERLGRQPVRPVTDADATLPAVLPSVAEAVRSRIDELCAAGLVEVTGHRGDPFALIQGSLVAQPVVLVAPVGVAVPDVEFPMPFVVVAPWRERDGIQPLRHSLVLNLLTDRFWVDAELEPTVRKVVYGLIPPWTTVPGLPHDGSLRDFLSEPKAVLSRATPVSE
jgi:hypothetical protein